MMTSFRCENSLRGMHTRRSADSHNVAFHLVEHLLVRREPWNSERLGECFCSRPVNIRSGNQLERVDALDRLGMVVCDSAAANERDPECLHRLPASGFPPPAFAIRSMELP